MASSFRWVFSFSQRSLLTQDNSTYKGRDKHPCPKLRLNLRSQQPNGRDLCLRPHIHWNQHRTQLLPYSWPRFIVILLNFLDIYTVGVSYQHCMCMVRWSEDTVISSSVYVFSITAEISGTHYANKSNTWQWNLDMMYVLFDSKHSWPLKTFHI
jgi:hypothetical protein